MRARRVARCARGRGWSLLTCKHSAKQREGGTCHIQVWTYFRFYCVRAKPFTRVSPRCLKWEHGSALEVITLLAGFEPALILPVIPHMVQVLRGVSAASDLKADI